MTPWYEAQVTPLRRFHELFMTLLVQVILEVLALTVRQIDPYNVARRRSQQIHDKRRDRLLTPVESNHRDLLKSSHFCRSQSNQSARELGKRRLERLRRETLKSPTQRYRSVTGTQSNRHHACTELILHRICNPQIPHQDTWLVIHLIQGRHRRRV